MGIRILNHYVHLQIVLLAVVELLALICSVYIGASLRFSGPIEAVVQSVGPLWPRAMMFSATVFFSLVALGLYHARLRTQITGVIVRVLISFFLSGAAMGMFFYAFPSLYIGRGALALALMVALVLICIIRVAFFTLVDDRIFKRRVLVYGTGRKAANLLKLRRRSDRRGFRIVGFAASNDEEPSVKEDRIVCQASEMTDYALRHRVDEVVVAVDDRRGQLAVQELLDCKLAGVQVTDALGFFERETGKVKLDLLYPSWLIFSDGFDTSTGRLVGSRIFDIAMSLLLLLVAWPLMLAVVIAIKIEEGIRAPVFYRQSRVGLRGKTFDVLKFRSMRVDAERDGVAKWAEKNDSRVTRVGKVIRKYRLDELPQLFNVLLNQMAFVGPRPERPGFVSELSQQIPYYRERHCVKPGITGWAQLCYEYGSSTEDALEKLQYDLYYVKNHNLVFDLMILLQTAEVVLWKAGAR